MYNGEKIRIKIEEGKVKEFFFKNLELNKYIFIEFVHIFCFLILKLDNSNNFYIRHKNSYRKK